MKQHKLWQKVAVIICPFILAVFLYFIADFILAHFTLPECLTYKIFGIYCPGCGMTRSVVALLQGDILLSLRQNAFIIAGILILILLYLRFVLIVFDKSIRRIKCTDKVIYILLTVAAVYSILRNFIPAIAPM